jgi:hypothetical protein
MFTLYAILSLLEIYGLYQTHTPILSALIIFIIFLLGLISLYFIWKNFTKNMDFLHRQTSIFLGGFFISSTILSYFTTTLFFVHWIEKLIK